MKQNGVRLVQRKFAQGVPIPASVSNAAPLPPERKPEASYPPRNVYHNKMSARSLLDIVSMQNIHTHEPEPLVVLERLRADEIPPPPPKVRVRLIARQAAKGKRRAGLKVNKNNMCLRSGKRKSPDAVKSSARKRKKLSSESTDDVPLKYYFNRPSQTKPVPVIKAKDTEKKDRSLERDKRTATPKRRERSTRLSSDKTISSRAESTISDKSEDRSFTFKEPSSPARLSYRLFKKRKATVNTGRALKKAGLAKPAARWASLRSVRAPSVVPSRNTAVHGKKLPKPAVRKGLRTASKDDPPSQTGPSTSRTLRSLPAENKDQRPPLASTSGLKASKATPVVSLSRPVPALSPAISTTDWSEVGMRPPSSPELTFEIDMGMSRLSSTSGQDWCINNDMKSVAPSIKSDITDATDMIVLFPSELPVSGTTGTNSTNSANPDIDSIEKKIKEDIENFIRKNNTQVAPKEQKITKAHEKDGEKTKEKSNSQLEKRKNEHDLDSIKEKAWNEELASTNVEKRLNRQGQASLSIEKRHEELAPSNAEKRHNEKGLVASNVEKKRNEELALSKVERRNEKEQASSILDRRQSENSLMNLNIEKKQNEKGVMNSNIEKRSNEKGVMNLNIEKRLNEKGVMNSKIETRQNEKGVMNSNIEERQKAVSITASHASKEKDIPEVRSVPENRTRQKRDAKSTTGNGVKKTIAKKGKMTPEKKDGRKTAPKTINQAKNSKAKRSAKIVEEAATSTRLLRNTRDPPPTDVYEFDAELEAARPPSGLRRRGQPSPDPASPDSAEYVDILPASSHCVRIPKNGEESGEECLSVSLVPKEEISIKKKKNLIENLSNSPALLNKFFNCLTAEMQNELDNLITAEGLHEQASTSAHVASASTYLDQNEGIVKEAPTFYPTHEEFQDPIKYYHKIAPQASRFGLCKIVPPAGFKPPCNMNDSIRFAVIYQYISKMYNRWGPVSRELAAIKAHLWSQSVVFTRPPLLDGSEVNLPKLYHAVERNGGLSTVIKRNRWGRVADEMKLCKLQNPEKKLDPIYMRYLLPYATLSDQERQNIMAKVEKCWTTKYQKMLERARNPFQRQNRMLGTESESDDDGDDGNTAALLEAEDCIVQGRIMNLVTFKKIATSLMDAHFEPSKQPPTAAEVEKAYYKAVLLGTEHIVANTASIDTGEEGYGFPKDPEAEYGTHPWNLKVLARNPNNVLRYLGPVLGVTVPTLHLSMLFSTSCWHRDPHGLPWTEYMHSGAEKIWYGIPRDESANFRRAVETLCPAYCQNKAIWLASEITMVPPNILSDHGVKLSRLSQRPGEYVLVFPEAHSCSITTGFGISESVYFASNAWLKDVYKLFQELRNSCEPTMFSLEQLLINGSADPAAPQQVSAVLCTLLTAELEHRRALEHKGLKVQERPPSSAPLNTSYFRTWNTRDQDECEYCRSTLFLSKVTGLTGRKSAVCPEHALRLLDTKKYKNVNLSELEFLSSYTTHALEEMLDRLESRAEEAERAAPPPAVTVIDLTDEPRGKGAQSHD